MSSHSFKPDQRPRRLVRCPRCGLESVEGSNTLHDCRPFASQMVIMFAVVLAIFLAIALAHLAYRI
jgi:hypothetical protein